MDMTPRIIAEESITPEEDAEIRDALCVCFPADAAFFAQARGWHGSRPAWSVVVELRGRVIAHVGVTERKVRVGDEERLAAGVMNVLVVPEYRKQHLFRQVMALAMEEAYRRGFDLGLLFCLTGLIPLYGALGWRLLGDRTVTRLDENGLPQPIPEKNVTMFYPLNRADLPPGALHLQGNDW